MEFNCPVISFDLYNQLYKDSTNIKYLENGEIDVENSNFNDVDVENSNFNETNKELNHTILIPQSKYFNFINSDIFIDSDSPLYLKITKIRNVSVNIYETEINDEIGIYDGTEINDNINDRIEINDDLDFDHNNSMIFGNCGFIQEDLIVLPFWVINKLKINMFEVVNIQNIINLPKIGFLKIKGTNSDYTKLENIKEILENELNTYRAITINDLIYIYYQFQFQLEFYIIEIKDIFNKEIKFGSLFNTEVNIEFEIPSDIAEKERQERIEQENIEQERIEQERIYKEELKQKEIEKERLFALEKEKECSKFKGTAYSLLDSNQKPITHEEYKKLLSQKYKNNSNS
jgi:hypothetical protein